MLREAPVSGKRREALLLVYYILLYSSLRSYMKVMGQRRHLIARPGGKGVLAALGKRDSSFE